MKGVPKALNDRMWQIAENDRPDEIAAFFDVQPELRDELVRRLEMVRSLRGARPTLVAPADVETVAPAFEPSATLRPLGRPKWIWVSAFTFLLCAFVFAGFAAFRYLNLETAKPGSERVAPLEKPPAKVGTLKPEDLGAPDLIPPREAVEPPAQPEEPEAFQRLITVRFTEIGLADALRAVAAAGNLEVEIPPGLEDKLIEVDYVQAPVLAVLRDMGRTFGFTPFVQGQRSVLIVPALDPGAPPPADVIAGTSRLSDGVDEPPPPQESN